MPQPHERAVGGGAVQSLPSFAQAFSNIPNDDRALPPIQHHQSQSRPQPQSLQQHPALSPPTQLHHHRLSHRSSSISNPNSNANANNTRLGRTHLHPRNQPHSHLSPSKKRPRDDSPGSDGYESSDSSAGRPTGIKEENDVDQLDPSPPPPPSSRLKHIQPPPSIQRQDSNSSSLSGSGGGGGGGGAGSNVGLGSVAANGPPAPTAPPPSLSRPSPALKRRRVTISGVAQPLNTNLRSSDLSSHTPTTNQNMSGGATFGPSTPISPVVMGFTIQPDDPQAFEQVRSMLSVKQKQKALIESRRGSVAGLVGDGRRGSTAGIGMVVEGRRGSVPGLPSVAPIPQVSIVNPTPTSATAPNNIITGANGPSSSSSPSTAGTGSIPKRNGPSPNGNTPNSRLGRSPPVNSTTTTSASPVPRSAAIGVNNGNGNNGSNPSNSSATTTNSSARALSPAGHVVVPSQNQSQSQSQSQREGQRESQNVRLSSAIRSPPSSSTHQQQQQQNGPSTSQQGIHTHTHTHTHTQAMAHPLSHSQAQTSFNSPAVSQSSSSSQGQTQNQNQNQSQGSNQSQNQNQSLNQIQTGVSTVSGVVAAAASQTSTTVTSSSQSTSATQLATQGLTALANALPPLPNSFASRRAGQLGFRGKPADIVISPRSVDVGGGKGNATPGTGQGQGPSQSQTTNNPPPFNYKSLQPAIHSAPVRPGQQPGRFPTMSMALPTLPPAMGQRGTSVRRTVPGQVPPTPTGLSMQRQQGSRETSSVRLSQPTRSPGLTSTVSATGIGGSTIGHSSSGATASVPISNTVNAHLPRTPATLNQPSNTSSDKAAFLAPFEQFYDALSDARVLKGWFGDQLARVSRVVREVEEQRKEVEGLKGELERQKKEREKEGVAGVERLVAEAVQREVRSLVDEVRVLRGRVVELEDELAIREREREREVRFRERDIREMPEMGRMKVSSSLSSSSTSMGGGGLGRTMNGMRQTFPVAPGVDSYTFPPVQPMSMALPPPPSASIQDSRRSPSPRLEPLPPPTTGRLSRLSRVQGSRRAPSPTRSEASASPAPFESGRRLSVSAMRYDPPVQQRRSQQQQQQQSHQQDVEREEREKGDEVRRKDSGQSVEGSSTTTTTGTRKSSSDEGNNNNNGNRDNRDKDKDKDDGGEKPGLKRHNSHSGATLKVGGNEQRRGGGTHSRQNSSERLSTASTNTSTNAAAAAVKKSPKGVPRRPVSPMEED